MGKIFFQYGKTDFFFAEAKPKASFFVDFVTNTEGFFKTNIELLNSSSSTCFSRGVFLYAQSHIDYFFNERLQRESKVT